jgi:hypothetical protein
VQNLLIWLALGFALGVALVGAIRFPDTRWEKAAKSWENISNKWQANYEACHKQVLEWEAVSARFEKTANEWKDIAEKRARMIEGAR